MRKIFLDTNVVIDLLDKREPFYHAAVSIFPWLMKVRSCYMFRL